MKQICITGTALGFLLAAVLFVPPASGQAVYGTLVGTATDSSGAALPGATVTVLDEQKGTKQTTTTNGTGEYRVEHLIPDTYTVKIELTGFKTFSTTGLRVDANATPKIDGILTVGASDQIVEVSADSIPVLQTDSSQVATNFDQKTVRDLPLRGRNTSSLITLVPTAQDTGTDNGPTPENPQNSRPAIVNGQPVGGVDYELDGTSNQDTYLGQIIINPQPDSLSEVKVITQGFTAEFGKATAAVFLMETKSGTSKFHGEALYQRQSAAQQARNPFVPAQSYPNAVPRALVNLFEGNVGGPIFKDKAFFFFDYAGYRGKVPSTATTNVPTALLRSSCLSGNGCDFSEYATQFGASGVIYDPNGVAYAGNILPNSVISQQALSIFKLLPAPNVPGGAITNNFSLGSTGPVNNDQYTGRVDAQPTSKIHTFTRYTFFHDTLSGAGAFGVLGGTTTGPIAGSSHGVNQSVAIGADYAFNEKLLADVRVGYSRYAIHNQPLSTGISASSLGIPGLNTSDPATAGLPSFSLSGSGGFSFGTGAAFGCNCPLQELEEEGQIANNWTRIAGNHAVKFGVDVRYGRFRRYSSDQSRTGNLTFGNGPTSSAAGSGGLGLATFLLGDVTNFSRFVSTTTNAKTLQKRDFFYAQDTWRATPKLTLNYGLRYELYFPESVNGVGQGANLNLNTGNLEVAGYGSVPTNMGTHISKNGFAPRFGFAYQVDAKTVLRGGYGRSFSLGYNAAIFGNAPSLNLPITFSQNLSAPSTRATLFTLSQGPPTPTFSVVPASGELAEPNGVSGYALGPEIKIPTVDTWNFGGQRAISATMSVTAMYIGNKGTHVIPSTTSAFINPNEIAAVLGSSDSVTGQPLYYDPSVSTSTLAFAGFPGIAANGHTAVTKYLQRYYKPYGWTQAINQGGTVASNKYNALQITLEKRLAHGYSFTANYVYQRAYTYQTSYYTVDKSKAFGLNPLNRSQNFTFFGLYELPFGRNGAIGKNIPRWVDALIGGYELSGSAVIASGLPYTLTYSNCNTRVPSASAPCTPDYLGNTSFNTALTPYDPVTHSRHFFSGLPTLSTTNPTSGPFALPALDTIGNVGLYSQIGPNYWYSFGSFQKNIHFHESYLLQFRADAYNIFNHIAAANPSNTTIDAGTNSGIITGVAIGSKPRQLTFTARLQF